MLKILTILFLKIAIVVLMKLSIQALYGQRVLLTLIPVSYIAFK